MAKTVIEISEHLTKKAQNELIVKQKLKGMTKSKEEKELANHDDVIELHQDGSSHIIRHRHTWSE